jgi:Tfp pilus assembly protein PilF
VALGEAYLKAGNPAAARVEAERALELDPDSAEARRLLGTIK